MIAPGKLNNVQENVILANHTTFRIGGKTRYFFEARTKEDLKKALEWAKENNLPFFILGGGSNLLVSDKGFEGLVIKYQVLSIKYEGNKIVAEAGAPLAKLVMDSVNNNLTGLEWAAGIPGTIGGAICGNAGAYGRSISENATGCQVMNSEGELFNFGKKDCGFYYRGSIFKKNKELVVVEVELKLENDKNSEAKEMMKKNLTDRRNKIPPFSSSGSFFKNHVLKEENPGKDPLIERFPELKSKVKGGKLAAGLLIEQCGLKGKTIGGAQISEQHANFIINLGGAKAADVLELAKICKEKVKEKFGVELEEEIIFLGF